MAVVRMPRLFGGGPRIQQEPAPGWDKEMAAMQAIGEWLGTLPDKESRFRVLTYWMWREKSGDAPNIQDWVDKIAETSAERISEETGFK